MTTTTTTRRANTRHITAMLALASQADLSAGIEWYARAERLGRRLAHTYGCTFEQAVGVIAALSPNNRWARNCADAESMIRSWSVGTDPETVKVCTYGANRSKAAAILRLESPDRETIARILNGRKVTAFFLSITGVADAVACWEATGCPEWSAPEPLPSDCGVIRTGWGQTRWAKRFR